MAADAGKKQRRRGPGQPFQPGQSGNPNGRRPGTLNRVSLLAQRLMDDDAEAVILALIGAAKAGDVGAIKLVLERVAPLRRGRPIFFTMPVVERATDVAGALGSILKATAAGELTPEEASTIAGLLDANRRALEAGELERRLYHLEQTLASGGKA